MNGNPKFVILAVLDGWGLAPPGPGNAIAQAKTPNMNSFWASYPHTRLRASGEAVGLPRGEDGNTETGHLNLGAGRIVYQELERINMSIADGAFFENEVLISAIEHAKKNNSNLHLMGLVGAGGVHSNIEHLFALIRLSSKHNFDRLFIHVFTDGRDSPQTSAKTYINNLKKVIEKEGVGEIASVMGRYWAMDRDRRWDRTKKAYDALTKGTGEVADSPTQAIEASYDKGNTDEFIEPTIITKNSKPVALVKDDDAVIFFNFRIDRPRQLTSAFVMKDFLLSKTAFDFDPYKVKYEKTHLGEKAEKKDHEAPFKRDTYIKNLYFVTMTKYSEVLAKEGTKTAFPPEKIKNPLGKVIADKSYRQLRITESEKERFVTFYFNGLNEYPFAGEERLILPSPKVPTYDQEPQMAADAITQKIVEAMKSGEYKFILVNYPNADMVGHTGNIGPAVKAVEKIDECLGRLSNHVLAYGGMLFITADHGNAEEMINTQTGMIDTEHSTNPIPFIAVSQKYIGKTVSLKEGILADVAPTVLSCLGISIPSNMTGRDLLQDLRE